MTDSSPTLYLDPEAHLHEEIEPADGSAGLLYALMSEEALAQDWLGPEKDEAWCDLRVVM
ncbi:MAG: hypothetical protein M3Z04_06985 [Chloroflexota bacterium]|nr:hypothetical protein [Chloroflexota bacterium]